MRDDDSLHLLVEPASCDRKPHTVPARFFSCPHYDYCLAYAAEKSWPSFDCLSCVFSPEGLEEEHLEDNGTLMGELYSLVEILGRFRAKRLPYTTSDE